MTAAGAIRSMRRRSSGHSALIAGVLFLAVILALFATGRLDSRRWQPFLDLSTWRFLGEGLLLTLFVGFVSLVLSLMLGIPVGIARFSLRGPLKLILAAAVELVRATPILAIVFITLIAMNRLVPGIDPVWPGIVGLSMYNIAVIGEIVRAGIASIPSGQVEAARSLGLGYLPTMRAVVLPQALAQMTPALVSQLITLIKDTTLLFIISASELVSHGRSLFVFYGNVLETWIVIACIFFAINYPLSRLSRRLEARRPVAERIVVSGEEDQALLAVPTGPQEPRQPGS
jgi:glutamate transport system permease protein